MLSKLHLEKENLIVQINKYAQKQKNLLEENKISNVLDDELLIEITNLIVFLDSLSLFIYNYVVK